MRLTQEQIKSAFDWLRERVLPPARLKVEIGDKDYKAGFIEGYKTCYGSMMMAEKEYIARLGLRDKYNKSNGA